MEMSLTKKEKCDDLKIILDLIDNAFDYEKALQRINQTQENVNFLRQLIKSVEIIPQSLHDKQLLCFLFAADNAKGAVKLATNYYEIRNNGPELFGNRNFELSEIKQCLANQIYINLPLTPNNECVIFHGLSNSVAKNYVFDEALKTFIMLSETSLFKHGPRDGFIFIFDLKYAGLGHLARPSIKSMMKGFKFLEDCAPIKLKAVHVLNSVPFSGMILAMIKPFARSDLISKVHFHYSSMDYNKFFDEVVPKSCMPSDYGGDLLSVEELHKQTCKELNIQNDYFLMEQQQAALETTSFSWNYHKDCLSKFASDEPQLSCKKCQELWEIDEEIK